MDGWLGRAISSLVAFKIGTYQQCVKLRWAFSLPSEMIGSTCKFHSQLHGLIPCSNSLTFFLLDLALAETMKHPDSRDPEHDPTSVLRRGSKSYMALWRCKHAV